jgi:hypothetical protein
MRRYGALQKALKSGSTQDSSSDFEWTFGNAFLLGFPVAALISRMAFGLAKDAKPLRFHEMLVLVWYVIDAITHLTIELGYVILALTTTAEKTDSFMGWIWREYSRADARWAVRDPNVISLECLTVFIGVLCLFQIKGVLSRSAWRHPLQIIICTAELYGGWMTFAPEWVEGSPNLNGQDPVLLWIYLVFMNGLWVVVPALLLWDSFVRLTYAADLASGARKDLDSTFHQITVSRKTSAYLAGNLPSKAMWYAGAAFVVAYNILVPAVIFSAEGVPVKGAGAGGHTGEL